MIRTDSCCSHCKKYNSGNNKGKHKCGIRNNE